MVVMRGPQLDGPFPSEERPDQAGYDQCRADGVSRSRCCNVFALDPGDPFPASRIRRWTGRYVIDRQIGGSNFVDDTPLCNTSLNQRTLRRSTLPAWNAVGHTYPGISTWISIRPQHGKARRQDNGLLEKFRTDTWTSTEGGCPSLTLYIFWGRTRPRGFPLRLHSLPGLYQVAN